VALVNVIPDLGGSFAYRLRVSARSRLGLARGRGSATGSVGAAVVWLLVEGGHGELAVGTETIEVEGRQDVFEAPGWSALLGPGTRFAVRGDVRYTIAGRGWSDMMEPRILRPRAVTVERRGKGPDERVLRTYVGEGPLICGETLTQPGRWSSWPPHSHEHEEVALFRFDPLHGFGVQVLDAEKGGRRADVVNDGDVRRIRAGFHSVAAAPGAVMCSLWVLAGETTTLAPELEPDLT
jgi:5-deoxy-D-glucuronate isomerase